MSKKNLIITIVGMVFLAFMISLLYINKTTFRVNINDKNDTRIAMLSQFKIIAPNAIIQKIVVENEMIFVLYSYSESSYIGLKIFERAFPIGNQYQSKGGASSSSQKINTYNFTGRISDSNGLIVVFGDNTEIGASSYLFVNDGNEYTNIITDNYFIDIYFLDKMKTSNSSGITFFDKNGNTISVP